MKRSDKIHFINICILVEVITLFRVQFGINKHEYIFSKTNKIARARRASAICDL